MAGKLNRLCSSEFEGRRMGWSSRLGGDLLGRVISEYISIAAPSGHMRRSIFPTLLFSLSLAVPCAAQGAHKHEQEKPDKERPASEAHSFMELFTKLERDWIEAVQKKDKPALDTILAPEFMLRSSGNPENPIPRADWVQSALTSCDIRSFNHRAMAIRALLGVAAVSFVQSQRATIDGKDRSGDYFIVDLWEANGGKWRVFARYIAPVDNHVLDGTRAQE
jgi:Domain of unknown function (DUF4440)